MIDFTTEAVSSHGFNVLRPPFPNRAIGLRSSLEYYPRASKVLRAEFPEAYLKLYQVDILLLPLLTITFLENNWDFGGCMRQSHWHAAVLLNAIHRLSEVLGFGGNIAAKAHVITAILTSKTVDRVHELGCYLEVELSSYVGVLRARFG